MLEHPKLISQSLNKIVCQKLRSDACIIHKALSEAYDRDCTNIHLNMIDLSWYHQRLETFQLPDISFPERDCCSQTPQSWQTAKVRLEPSTPIAPTQQVNSLGATGSLTAARSSSKKLEKARRDRPPAMSSGSQSVRSAGDEPEREHIRSICSQPAHKLFDGYLLSSSDPYNKSMDRLAIASAAAWAVLLLCGTPWLEDTRMIENDIVLLTDQIMQAGTENLDNANAIPAFSYRFAKPGPPTGPKPGESSTKAAVPHRTLFALAVLLIEIGLDTDFSNLYEDFVSRKRGSSATGTTFNGLDHSETLLQSLEVAEEAAEDLYFAVCDSYMDAVKCCLRFPSRGRRGSQRFDNEIMRENFFSWVVAPVHERYEQEGTPHRVFRTG
ncbi:hypothetical protein PG985_007798 [Apiospora marii]|uniref:DUF7580 domain-containing protein n=1 Tax=Apiospora marii TaxID=335849 RepID=A0ABR1SSE2_9PEZI